MFYGMPTQTTQQEPGEGAKGSLQIEGNQDCVWKQFCRVTTVPPTSSIIATMLRAYQSGFGNCIGKKVMKASNRSLNKPVMWFWWPFSYRLFTKKHCFLWPMLWPAHNFFTTGSSYCTVPVPVRSVARNYWLLPQRVQTRRLVRKQFQ